MVYDFKDIARILKLNELLVTNWYRSRVIKAEHTTEKQKSPRFSLLDLYAIAIHANLNDDSDFSRTLISEIVGKWREKSLKLGKPLGTVTHWIPNLKVKAKKPVSLVAILLNAAPIVESADKAIVAAERKETQALKVPQERKRAPYAKPDRTPESKTKPVTGDI